MDSELSDSVSSPLGSAPAVVYPLSSPVLLHAVLLLVLCLAMCVDLAWVALASAGDWRPWIGLLATAGIAAWCWWKGPLTEAGRLSWDGADWRWESVHAPISGAVHVRLDTQSALLVRFVTETADSRWLWLARATDPAHWLALRRAVHAGANRRSLDRVSVPAVRS